MAEAILNYPIRIRRIHEIVFARIWQVLNIYVALETGTHTPAFTRGHRSGHMTARSMLRP